MIKFFQISDQEKNNIYRDISNKLGLPPQSIEKDFWVTLMLRMVFSTVQGENFIFKGGTSLSKGFDLIQRFSEDIDLGIDRKFFGFDGDLNKGEIRKLRRACHTFVSNEMVSMLNAKLLKNGVEKTDFELVVENIKISDQDPETISVNYKSLYDEISYLPNNVKIEISARSLIEPCQKVKIRSWIDEEFANTSFTEKGFLVRATDPRKTFIEKLLLLHEEFQKPANKIRHFRMSRHYYDISKILNTEFGKSALEDHLLFDNIVAHRKIFTPVKTTEYEGLKLHDLKIIPPKEHLNNYKSDYLKMQDSMIHGISDDFDVLLEGILDNLKF